MRAAILGTHAVGRSGELTCNFLQNSTAEGLAFAAHSASLRFQIQIAAAAMPSAVHCADIGFRLAAAAIKLRIAARLYTAHTKRPIAADICIIAKLHTVMLQLHAVRLQLAAVILRPNIFVVLMLTHITQMLMQSTALAENVDCKCRSCFVSGVQTALTAGGRGRSCNINFFNYDITIPILFRTHIISIAPDAVIVIRNLNTIDQLTKVDGAITTIKNSDRFL